MYGKLLIALLVACVSAIPPPEYPSYPQRGCNYQGQEYNVGQKFPAGDGCNTCVCKSSGRVSCSDNTCFCTYNGQKYNVGQSFPAGDGCNTCTCGSDGQVACTEKFCHHPPPGNVCSEPKPNCEGYFKRWYYNSYSNKCEQFTGCKGYGNNFSSKDACLSACSNSGYGK
uniref:Kielin/chordin-like protein n=1 Tax=Crassostrea virginica TaxID=6565 RepID=A0A8B8C9K6_CRAVI|nr:kielin/chordin-like protein [Crassostrea virginica]